MITIRSDVIITMPCGTGGPAPRIINLGTGMRSEIRCKVPAALSQERRLKAT